MRTILLAIFVFVFPVSLFPQSQNAIHGVWQNNDFGYTMTLVLNTNGSGEFDGDEIQFTTTSNKLKLIGNGNTTTYDFFLHENSLDLSAGDLDATITFSRTGTISKPAIITNNTASTSTTLLNNQLIGIWSGNGETIEFKKDGECVYIGNVYKFQSGPDRITLTTNLGDVSFGYSITGDQLVLTGNAGQVAYSRGIGAAAGQPAVNNTKAVAMELIGKWCWVNVSSTNSGGSQSSRCIMLNADGTYLYQSERSASVNTDAYYGGTNSQSSDQGTWSVQGDRLFYNSQTSGQGSYRLEKRNHPKNVNDPMIILDGEAYVTVTLRQPWR